MGPTAPRGPPWRQALFFTPVSVDLLESLHTFTGDLRNQFDEFENRATVASGTSDYHSTVARSRKRRKCFDEYRDNEVVLQGRAKFRVTTFSVIIDQLSTALRHRIDAYSQVRGTFKVITDFRELDHDSIRECSLSLATTYSNDLQPPQFRLRRRSSTHLHIIQFSERCRNSFANSIKLR